MKIFILLLFAFAILPTTFGQAKNSRTVKIYLSDTNNNPDFEDCGKVRAVNRTIPKTKTVAKAALEELFKGATKAEKAKGLTSIFSQEQTRY
jgi:spore germination protein GerM